MCTTGSDQKLMTIHMCKIYTCMLSKFACEPICINVKIHRYVICACEQNISDGSGCSGTVVGDQESEHGVEEVEGWVET